MTPQDLTEYLHAQIPLTAALALHVVALDDRRMEIAAPLAPNVNHRGTAFGGSLATLAIISGWALVNEGLTRENITAHLMVRNSTCDFREAVTGAFSAVSLLPEARWPTFIKTLRRHRRAAIEVETIISSTNGTSLVTHRGRFAALLEPLNPMMTNAEPESP